MRQLGRMQVTRNLLIVLWMASCAEDAERPQARASHGSSAPSPGGPQVKFLNDCDIDIRPRKIINKEKQLQVLYTVSDLKTEFSLLSNAGSTVYDDNDYSHGEIPTDKPMNFTVQWSGVANKEATVTSEVDGKSSSSGKPVMTRGTYDETEPVSSPCFELEKDDVWTVIRVQNRGKSTALYLRVKD